MTPLILMIALSTHAIFEGMAVGIMDKKADVINLVVAIALHKGAEAMALVRSSQSGSHTCACRESALQGT